MVASLEEEKKWKEGVCDRRKEDGSKRKQQKNDHNHTFYGFTKKKKEKKDAGGGKRGGLTNTTGPASQLARGNFGVEYRQEIALSVCLSRRRSWLCERSTT